MDNDRIILDAMYDTRSAGELMGGLHPNQVNVLIKEGRLEARLRPVRGARRGRTVIPGFSIKKFNESLPVKRPDGSAGPAKELETELAGAKRKRRPSRVKLNGPSW